jgi:hypothetical protein
MIPYESTRRDPLALRHHAAQHGLSTLLIGLGVSFCFFGAIEIGLAVAGLATLGAFLERESGSSE